MITVPVKLGDRSDDVLVGKGARHRLLEVLPVGVQRAAIVTQEEIGVRVDAGIDQHVFTIDSGEEAKNLVGAFWQPAAVLCDTEVLESLPPEEYRSGLGEVAKCQFLPDGDGLADLPLDEKVARCVEIKARVVGADEREGGLRAILNYGHTLAHALETAGHYDLRHGEAVAIGLVFAARLAERLGRIDGARVDDHVKLVASYDLPVDMPPGADREALLEVMGRDKKALAGLTFVLDGPRGVEVVAGVPRDEVLGTLVEFVP